MGGVSGVGSGVLEHGVDCGGEGVEVGEAGEHGAVADVVLEEEGGALGGLEGMKFGC